MNRTGASQTHRSCTFRATWNEAIATAVTDATDPSAVNRREYNFSLLNTRRRDRRSQRYMHISPAAIDNAIRLLESSGVFPNRGDIVETGSTETANSSR